MTADTGGKACQKAPFLRHQDPRMAGSRQGTGKTDGPDRNDLAADQLDAAVLEKITHWGRYCALAIKIDPAVPPDAFQSLDRRLMQLLADAATAGQSESCRWREGHYCCVLPDTDTDSACHFARGIQKRLSRQPEQSVTIGIAPFPLLGYSHEQTIANTGKALDHAALLGPGQTVVLDAVSLNISGDRYFQLRRFDRAMDEYRAARLLDPKETNVINSLGVCLAQKNDLAAAKTEFQAVLDIDNREAMAIFNLGMIALLEKDEKSALAFFQSAYTRDPNLYEIPFQIGKLLTAQGHWNRALPYLNAAIDLGDTDWRAFNLKGKCLASLEETNDALKAYERSVKLNPDDADGLSALGRLYDIRGESPEICKIFLQQSIALAPDNGLFRHRLGLWYHKNGHAEKAAEKFDQAASLGHAPE